MIDLVDVAPGRVLGARDVDLDICGSDVPVVHCRHLQAQLQAVAPQHLDIRQQLERALDVLSDAVRHQLERAVRRGEGDLAVHVELREPHALVETVVIEGDALICRSHLVVAGHDKLVVHAEFAFWHTRKLALHEDLTRDVRSQTLLLGRHHDVDVLDHINVDLVFPVLDALCTPRANTRGLHGDFFQLLLVIQVYGLGVALRDVLFQNICLQNLWVPVVNDFVQQLVDENEVLTDLILVEGAAKVCLKDLHDLEKQLEDKHHIDIVLGRGRQHDIALQSMEEVAPVYALYWRVSRLLRGNDPVAEGLPLGTGDIVLVCSPDQDLALEVDEENGRYHPDALASKTPCWA
mmetsp:Transcript_116490/g.301904  ORF Transcript_116490/g.301904 Transcript_116490/m.301904 type:complete len:349 (+) Transcript_116490:378-1424(+)